VIIGTDQPEFLYQGSEREFTQEDHWKCQLESTNRSVTLLRQIKVEIANGKPTPQACHEAQITVQTYYRWRKDFGELKLDQASRLKEMER
jgi:hypothetical protein